MPFALLSYCVAVCDHDPRVLPVLYASACICSRQYLRPWHHHDRYQQTAPDALHTDHQQRRHIVVGHQLLLEHILTALNNTREEDQKDAKPEPNTETQMGDKRVE